MDNDDNRKVEITLSPEIPVAGCEITATVRFNFPSASLNQPYRFSFTWYRKQTTCSLHEHKPATLQCISCVTLKLPEKGSYFCSVQCYSNAWKQHKKLHARVIKEEDTDIKKVLTVRSCGSWVDLNSLVPYEVAIGRDVVKLGDSETYMTTEEDIGYCLMLELAVLGRSTGSQLLPRTMVFTYPVIPFPIHHSRPVIQVGSRFDSDGDVRFSVLTYNILAQLLMKSNHCPKWALSWEYRRENLLREIVEYNADIICLQEVQKDHLTNFFEPKLRDLGYSVRYKAKIPTMYTGSGLTSDGCATFYRDNLFKEIITYEIDFDNMAVSMIEEKLDPEIRSDAKLRLAKDNVALLVILEVLNDTNDGFPHRLCVANTHIFANPKFPDVKLFQVVSLVSELEKITGCQVPLLLCGDFNTLPHSNPHKFLVRGKIDSPDKETKADPFGIIKFLKLHHSLSLRSAYASLHSSEMPGKLPEEMDDISERAFTCVGRTSMRTVDYIFYTEDSLSVEGLLELLDIGSVKEGLPSPLWSSDHVALMASFRVNNAYPSLAHHYQHHQTHRSTEAATFH